MADVAEETAYYLNSKIPAVAMIAEGVRFPPGSWRWVAAATALAWHVEAMLDDMFPALRGKEIKFATLMSDYDVKEFERSLEEQR